MTDGIATYVGVDWASVTHYAFALDPEGGKLGYKGFVHSGDGLAELVEWIRRTAAVEPGRVAIGIEVPHGPVVESLMEAGFQVYALNPKQLDRFRDRFTVAGAKDDRRDALVLADALRTDRQAYRLLEPMHPTIIELREWSRMTEDLSAERNRLANRFRHQLWRYFPQVIDLAEDWASLWILDLWDLIPTPARARTVRPETVAKLLKRTKVRRWTADTGGRERRGGAEMRDGGVGRGRLIRLSNAGRSEDFHQAEPGGGLEGSGHARRGGEMWPQGGAPFGCDILPHRGSTPGTVAG